MQFGLNWLIDNAPDNAPCVLLHGDFRTGNLLINEGGLAGVLDWSSHIRVRPRKIWDTCANVWRLGI